MNVSSVKNLNGETFSAVQDATLTDVVQSNSAQWNQGGNPEVESYVQTNSGTIDDTVTTFQTNSSTYMVEPNLEYNAVNEISGYNGSAIAQYGAEKQWLVHDDTLVHASNSAQYALGVNLSAIAQLLGVDETVLFDTTAVNGSGVCNLSESLKNFKRIKVLATRGYGGTPNPGGFAGPWSEWETDGISADGEDFHSIAPFMFEGVNWKNSMYSADSTFTTLTWYQGQQTNIITHVGSTANSYTGCVGIKKIVGIGRKQ